MEFITIGEVINTRGLKGELKIRPLTSDINRYRKLRLIYIGGKPYKIIGINIENKFVYLTLSDITSRETADLYRGKFVEIDRINAVPTGDDEYFIADLIGMDVKFEDGESLGRLTEINQYGAADVINVKKADGKLVSFPFLKKLVLEVKVAEKEFIIDRKIYGEVAVDEEN